MTVKDVIEKLSQLPEDTEVYVGTDCGGVGEIYIIEYCEATKTVDLKTFQ